MKIKKVEAAGPKTVTAGSLNYGDSFKLLSGEDIYILTAFGAYKTPKAVDLCDGTVCDVQFSTPVIPVVAHVVVVEE